MMRCAIFFGRMSESGLVSRVTPVHTALRKQQIFLCEQFAQIPYRLDGFILARAF
jgi:hypothetical protein